jgi:hypothetical protein
MPDELRRAREYARGGEGNAGTEGMRRAMLEYKRVVEGAVGASAQKAARDRRREVA